MPGKYVCTEEDTYEDARAQVKTSVGLTGKIIIRLGLHQKKTKKKKKKKKEEEEEKKEGLHQGFSLSPCLFDLIVDVLDCAFKVQLPFLYLSACCLQISPCFSVQELRR